MPAPAPIATSYVNPIPYVEVYFPALQRQNLVLNPNLEVNATSWGVTGALSVGRSTAQFYEGTASLLITMNALPQAGATSNGARMAVAQGGTYTASGYMRDNSTAVQWKAGIAWYNAASGGSLIGYTYGADTTINSLGWTRLSVTADAPAGALGAQVVFVSSTAPSPSTTAYLDAVLFEQSPFLNTYYTGVAGTAGTPDTITVYRLCDGVTSAVRGANGVSASTSFVVNDYEAPFGAQIQYWATTSSSGVSLGTGDIETITVSNNYLWIHDPLDITNWIQISLDGNDTAVLGQDSFKNISRGVAYNRSNVIGKTRPILQYYGQKAIEGAQFNVITHDAGTTDMEDILATAPVLIRPPAALGDLPRAMYGVLEMVQEPLTWHVDNTGDLTRWNLTYNETEPQSVNLVFTLYDYTYWQSRYGTYSAAAGVYGTGTYTYAVRNPPA